MSKTLRIILITASYVALTALTVYLFPRYNNAFNYHFEIGKPWGYDLVTAEFDFPIYKTDAEVMQQQREAIQNITPCYTRTTELPNGIYVLSLEDYERLKADGYKRVSVRTDRHVASTLAMNCIRRSPPTSVTANSANRTSFPILPLMPCSTGTPSSQCR